MNTRTKYIQPPLQPPTFNFLPDQELVKERGNEFIFDVECYPNYFMVGFMSYVTGRVTFLEHTDSYAFPLDKLRWMMDNLTLTGFNSRGYDIPMLWAARSGLNCGQLHAVTCKIITTDLRLHHIEKQFGFKCGYCDSIDPQQVAPAAAQQISLKHYGARLSAERLQELPINPSDQLTNDQMAQIKHYNVNDLVLTKVLRDACDEPMKLRKQMGKAYGIDLRSLSDSQIAEKTISSELRSNAGMEAFVPKIDLGTTFKFQNPKYVKFFSKSLQVLHKTILDTVFIVTESKKKKKRTVGVLNKNGQIVTATNLWKVRIGKTDYKLGIGGLHSSEKKQTAYTNGAHRLIDRDVSSYYPAIMLNQELYPEHLGPAFLDTFRDIYERRLKAKTDGDKSTSNSLKIAINGTFGKLGSQYSVVYSPNLLCQVTLTGQLSLLMLVEMLEHCGIPVISANTDGVVMTCPHDKTGLYQRCVADWERITNFETDETLYRSIHSRDVNNYVAITTDGEIKAKGSFTNELSYKDVNRESMMSNPNAPIVSKAVMLFLKTCREPNPITIESTISKSKKLTDFLFARRVTGGAVKDGVYLGKVIRWYIQQGQFGHITNARPNKAGIKAMVSETAGARPVVDLGSFPKDLDRDWYIRRAHSILDDVGYYGKDEQLELF